MKNSRQELMGLLVKGTDGHKRVLIPLTHYPFQSCNFANTTHIILKNFLNDASGRFDTLRVTYATGNKLQLLI